MRTLIYKRTHSGDPDPETGEFGCNNCMGSVRSRRFDAVIGIGGIGREPKSHGIAGKLTWIGVGPRKIGDPKSPRVTFDHFWYQGEHGPLLEKRYPALARRMYDERVRVLMHSPSPAAAREVNKIDQLDRDVRKILCLASAAPPSNRPCERDFRHTSGKCRPKSRDVRTTPDCRPPKRSGVRCNREPK
jgi:hypothetical protein